jgi:superfamily I DNA/RNA helicase
MAYMQRPGWLTELIGIVQTLCTHTESGTSKPTRQAIKIGRVAPDVEQGAGWFWIGLTGKQPESEQLEDGYLAPAEGAGQRRYQLIESVQDGNVLKLRVARHAPADGLFLWIPRPAPGLLESSLLKGLSEIDRFYLVDRFAQGHADPVATDPGHSTITRELKGEQPRALIACCSPGVHLVWGPPGTGKTKVIALALQDLIDRGKSALLVSATNIAVDNALSRAAKAINPDPGVMVRAGPPHLAEVAGNPAICLQKLVNDRQEVLEQRRCWLEQQITARQQHPDVIRLAEVRAELKSFDLAAFQAAQGRVTNAKQLIDRATELERLRRRSDELAVAAESLRLRAEKIRATYELAEPARQRITKASGLQRRVDALALEQDAANADVLRLEGIQNRLTAELDAARERRRFGHRHQRTLVRENAMHLAKALSRRDELAERLPPMTARLIGEIENLGREALPYTREMIARLDDDLRTALADVKQADSVKESHARRIGQLAEEVDQARRQPEPTVADRELVTWALKQGLGEKWARLPELQRKAEPFQQEIARLEEEYEKLTSQLRTEGIQVRQAIVRNAKVVACTLALLRIRPELREREYDYVIVDEAAFACPPEVLYAVSRAREGATLLGDFLQNGPIAPEAFKHNRANQIINRWYQRDCFAFFGIHDAVSAQQNEGCVTLSRQYRFGRAITELANAAAYGGILRMSEESRAGVESQEIVLIDVDGLGDQLAAVRPGPVSGHWWPVGALISRAIADRQVRSAEEAGEPAGAKAGIVVPYKIQRELIQDVLNESGASPQIEVGTSHRFQGREFDTVIFDLVEDGRGWVAKGDLGGLRMFNVGITRARRRLYLIANAAVVRRASTGPLHAIGRLLDAEKIHTVRAVDILGLQDAPAQDPIAREVWDALRDHATLIELYDEDRLPDELCRRIDEAQERIWLWSPWVGKRSEQLLPHLRDAQDRGVKVHAVVLPRDEVTRYLQPRHQDLAAQIKGTVYLRKEHQKIIVIDRKLTFIGSMNVLAHVPGGRHETMALFQSAMLADRVLEHERIDELADPPRCPKCNSDVRLVRALRRANLSRLHWICTAYPNGNECGWERAFAERPKTRNQPRGLRNLKK